jgi:hypothetical protein
MVRSVESAVAAQTFDHVRLLLLLQNCPEYLYWTLSRKLPRFVQAIPVSDTLSLSAARNLLLAHAETNGLLESEAVIGFPDDDCWYPAGTLNLVRQAFSESPQVDLWFCRYSSQPSPAATVSYPRRLAAPSEVIRHASSNTMFVRGRVLRSGMGFDETLGVGTINGGGEDTEFALRAYLASRRSLYVPAAVVGHRDKRPNMRPKYYRGGLIALARHASREPRIGVELIRKLAVGLWLVVTRQMAVAAFGKAIAAALRSRRAAAA